MPKPTVPLFREVGPFAAAEARDAWRLNKSGTTLGDKDHKRSSVDGLPGRDAISNPVSRYLRQIGHSELLTGAEEVEIAKKIEIGEQIILKAILQYTTALDYIINLGDEIKSRKQSAGKILMPIHRRGDALSPQDKIDLFLKTTRQLKKLRSVAKNSQEFDLTRERIRQIEARALQKLQQSKYSRSLKAFIDP